MTARSLALAAVALAFVVADAHAASPGQNGAIVFSRFAGDHRDGLYRVSPAGGGARRIVAGTVFGAGWAPSGDALGVLARPVGGQRFAVYTARPTGRGMRRLRRGDEDAQLSSVTWSPAGRRLAFTRSRGTDAAFRSAVWTMRRSGRGLHRLTPPSERATDAAWSPKGSTIAYVSHGRLRAMRPDGSRRRTLLASPASSPDWSPDGRRIVFAASGPLTLPRELAVYDMATGTVRPLAPAGVPEATDPSWSPDGTALVFIVPSGPRPGIYVSATDGMGARRIARGTRLYGPAWQPR